MNVTSKKLCMLLTLISTSFSVVATHYINNTGKIIYITNVSAKKSNKKSYFSYFTKKPAVEVKASEVVYLLELEPGDEGDLDNKQGDEVTITSPGMSDKRKLFPTNNSFNYVITMNNYNAMFEKFDINHAGNESAVHTKKEKHKKEKHKKNKHTSVSNE